MMEAQIDSLRRAVANYVQSNDECHLQEWIHQAEVLRALREHGLGTGAYVHLLPRSKEQGGP
jgi:hypothetical protein